MKTKILMSFISFIFLFIVYSNTIYAVTYEILETNKNIEEVIKDETQDELESEAKNDIETNNIIEKEIENIVEKETEINSIEEPVITTNVTDEIVEESLSITYEGKMYIETPTYHQNFTRPDNKKLKLGGWAVSNDANASLRVLIDGNIVASNLSRSSRGDVDRLVSPSYGGKKVTPKAGFSGTIDISHLNAGAHKLQVQELSRYGDLITSYEIPIQITNKKYQGKMYIENPTYNQNFTRPDNTKIKLGGWAVSNDANASLRVLIDGNIVESNLNRSRRGDVDNLVSPSYGGKKVTPKAGFSGTIDISNLNVGNHKIKVEELSRYGDLITSYEIPIQITNKKYRGKMYIENPTYHQNFTRPDNKKLKLGGWAVSNDANASLRVLIDGNIVASNLSRSSRGDVDNLVSPSYGGKKVTPKAGFSGTIDISNLNVGNHKIKVEELSRYGDLITSYEIPIQITNKKYQGKIYIENPTYNQNFTRPDNKKLKLGGWAVSNDANASLRVLIDGNIVESNLNRSRRGDVDKLVSPSYGGKKVTPKAGFGGTIDISHLNAGAHKLQVQELSRYGDLITSYEMPIQITNKKYYGEMCIDTPTYYQSYNYGSNIAVGGWAVSQDELATVEIYIDNVLKAKAERYSRPDVVYYMNKYDGKTIYAGFGKLISTSGLSSGTHKVTVYEKSRYGDIIGGVETKFVVKTATNGTSSNNSSNNNSSSTSRPMINTSGSKGIDVSQYQGTINWKNVANSGIKYAMIRIGYRGYGTGGLAEDTRFKTNFANAVSSGLKVGVYYYSTAINTTEAKKDAEYVINILRKYGYQNKISMPIALDLELISGVNTRDKNVSKAMRTKIANTFCSTISSYGYTPMVYACKSFLSSNINASQVPYDIWVAQYNSKCTYTGKYTIWQYTSSGKVSGINGNVDCNICYKNY